MNPFFPDIFEEYDFKENIEQINNATKPTTINHALNSLNDYGFTKDNYVLHIKEVTPLHHIYNLKVTFNDYYDVLVKYYGSNNNELTGHYTSINSMEIFDDICTSMGHNSEELMLGITVTHNPSFKINGSELVKGCIKSILFIKSEVCGYEL